MQVLQVDFMHKHTQNVLQNCAPPGEEKSLQILQVDFRQKHTCKMCCKIAPLLVKKNHCRFYKQISHRKHTQMSVLHTYTFVNARVFKNDTCRCWITCVQLQFYKCVFFFLLQNQHTHEQISAYTRVLFFCDYKYLPPRTNYFATDVARDLLQYSSAAYN